MTFLPQFKVCVEAGSSSLMCSYNRYYTILYLSPPTLSLSLSLLQFSLSFPLRINGVPACANTKLLTDILRKEWGFKGYVISDQGALGK